MRILLLGATGRTGLHVLSEALSRSHTITALVRRPSALSHLPFPLPTPTSLTILQGLPTSRTDILAAFASAPATDPIRAVISTLNNGRTSDSPWAQPTAPTDFMAQAARATLDAMREFGGGCEKVVWLGTVGVGGSKGNCTWFFNWVVERSNLKIAFEDHAAVQGIFEEEATGKNNGLKWTDVRAAGLTNGGKKAVKEFGDDGKGIGWLPLISRESVAGFLVDAVESDKWVGRTPVITN